MTEQIGAMVTSYEFKIPDEYLRKIDAAANVRDKIKRQSSRDKLTKSASTPGFYWVKVDGEWHISKPDDRGGWWFSSAFSGGLGGRVSMDEMAALAQEIGPKIERP